MLSDVPVRRCAHEEVARPDMAGDDGRLIDRLRQRLAGASRLDAVRLIHKPEC